MVHERDVFLELDQYPPAATVRPQWPGSLPQGVALASLTTPDPVALDRQRRAPWIAPPARYESVVYAGRRAATLRGPDGTLVEMVGL
jgi:hypothetical protein